ncbi:MAG TPA: very short patch repair endonuclease [Pseudorhizobium sp.]|nr:very short patch repair endonuclease [Pseudorhizobium sp.]
MSRVRQRGTKPELIVASWLRRAGYAYRLNVKSLPGSPDFANRKRKWAIFVNGCFWHHHTSCKRGTTPKSNVDFWQSKFSVNRSRDAAAIKSLRRRGYKVILIWECETLSGVVLAEKLQRSLKRVE